MYIRRMTRLVKTQNAELNILWKELKECKELLEIQKKSTRGNLITLQGGFALSIEEVSKLGGRLRSRRRKNHVNAQLKKYRRKRKYKKQRVV